MVDLRKLIGKSIIRIAPCECGYGKDYSHCLNGKYFTQKSEWVKLIEIFPNGNIVYEYPERRLSGQYVLDSTWNDGNWVEYDPVKQEIITASAGQEPIFVQERIGRFEGII